MGLRVVFAEDNYLLREGTVALLETVEELDVVAAVGDLPSLLEAVATTHPDAVLTDIRMPPTHGMEGIDAARQLRATHPRVVEAAAGAVVDQLVGGPVRHGHPIVGRCQWSRWAPGR
jgi:DNA-binding NarL/FixJ family response regulator